MATFDYREIAQQAYTKWCEMLNLKMEWNELPESSKEAWTEVVVVVTEKFNRFLIGDDNG